jgi:hypothetical protein
MNAGQACCVSEPLRSHDDPRDFNSSSGRPDASHTGQTAPRASPRRSNLASPDPPRPLARRLVDNERRAGGGYRSGPKPRHRRPGEPPRVLRGSRWQRHRGLRRCIRCVAPGAAARGASEAARHIERRDSVTLALRQLASPRRSWTRPAAGPRRCSTPTFVVAGSPRVTTSTIWPAAATIAGRRHQ